MTSGPAALAWRRMGKLLLIVALLVAAWWVLRPAPRRIARPEPPRQVPPRPARAKEPEGDAMVRVYDAAARDVVWMSAGELAPGMVEARVEGVEGLVWVDPGQIKAASQPEP